MTTSLASLKGTPLEQARALKDVVVAWHKRSRAAKDPKLFAVPELKDTMQQMVDELGRRIADPGEPFPVEGFKYIDEVEEEEFRNKYLMRNPKDKGLAWSTPADRVCMEKTYKKLT